MTKDKNIKKEKKTNKITNINKIAKTNKKIETKRKTKRKKINLVNILIILLAFSLLFSFVFKNKESFKNILTRQKRLKAYKANDLKIGDIVYYNHKKAADKNNEKNQKVTIEPGTAATPGYGGNSKVSGNQEFNVKNENTTWRVWDKLSDGRVMLVSNSPVAEFYTGEGIGHIWWEHNAHKISSIFGYGEGADTNATKDFPYKVGSGIDNAPDMEEGDKGNWKIGQNGINVSGSRSITMPDIEKKLGITEEKIKNGTDGIKRDTEIGYGKVTANTSMAYVVQRDIGSSNQIWEDKKQAKAKNNRYTVTQKSYWWEKSNIPETKYKEMLFNNINDSTLTGIATNALCVYDSGKGVAFGRGHVNSQALSSAFYWYGFIGSNNTTWAVGWDDSRSFRVVTFLKPDLTYYGKPDPDSNKTNEWDIIKPKVENKKIEIKNYQNIGFEPKINLIQNAAKTPLTKENNKYVKNIEVKSGIERQGSGDAAKFVELTPNTKYTLEVTNMPSGYTFEIEGKTNKEIDIKDKTSYTLIFKKDNKEIATRPAEASELNIGDIVYYNHKKVADKNNENNQKVTIRPGTAATPGYGVSRDVSGNQEFNAKNENTTWRVWDKLPDGRVMLVSNKTVARFYTGYGIGHIWWEHNAHKISSIFGYGYGADTNATKDFPYKVGSGIDNAPDMEEGDKGKWKIGQNGINVSGSRSITMPDIEQKLGLTEEKIKKRKRWYNNRIRCWDRLWKSNNKYKHAISSTKRYRK